MLRAALSHPDSRVAGPEVGVGSAVVLNMERAHHPSNARTTSAIRDDERTIETDGMQVGAQDQAEVDSLRWKQGIEATANCSKQRSSHLAASPEKKQTRAHPASEARSRTSSADLLRSYPARPLSPHASAVHITTRDGSGGAL